MSPNRVQLATHCLDRVRYDVLKLRLYVLHEINFSVDAVEVFLKIIVRKLQEVKT